MVFLPPNPSRIAFRLLCLAAIACLPPPPCAAQGSGPDALAEGWRNPPNDARLRAYWWWLNGNVTKESITNDLREMKAKGFGGALICDAGGATQDGNDPVPAGPVFLTPAWRDLYRHTLREAERLGLEMSLNIQSGWNLGGPPVKADDAAKKLVWSELVVADGGGTDILLPTPKARDGYYRDLFVVAYPLAGPAGAAPQAKVTASSSQERMPATLAADGDPATFWVSQGTEPGQGPTAAAPEWIEVAFEKPFRASGFTVEGREGYGPASFLIQCADPNGKWLTLGTGTAKDGEKVEVRLEAPDKAPPGLKQAAGAESTRYRLVVTGAYDKGRTERPRNVQVREIAIRGSSGTWPAARPGAGRRPIRNWEEKAVHKSLSFSAPDTTLLLTDIDGSPGEEDTTAQQVVDLTSKLDKSGVLRWSPPPGRWQVLRFGCTIGDHASVSTSSDGWTGYALDVLDRGAFQRYWDAVVAPLVADAGPLAGKTLKYLHTDSWEVEAVNWTPTLRAEFRQRRGYDFLPFLPTLAGRIVDDREATNRFLHDFRKTLGDLAIANHYQPFVANAAKAGLQIHPESGGPHASPIDAQRCLGMNQVPMSEFWAWSWKHRIGDENRFFVKQPASAAHTNGRKLVAAEGFTTIGPHWQETLWDNLKPSFDYACCEGLNLLVWHAFVCSPKEMGMPGQQYFAGTHLNPNVTWWSRSAVFFDYLNRCQWLLQQGLPVADVCYYYGDHVPNFAQLRKSDPARLGAGYDSDVITENTILNQLTVNDNRLMLPDRMSYRVLVLRDHPAISLPVLRKLRELVAAGAVVVGPEPVAATGLAGFPACDDEVRRLADELWAEGGSGLRKAGAGQVGAGLGGRQALEALGVPPDFAFTVPGGGTAEVTYIHRVLPDGHLYFVASRGKDPVAIEATFRCQATHVELWDAVTGRARSVVAPGITNGRTTMPLVLPPFGSTFVVFRDRPSGLPAPAPEALRPLAELAGPWQVAFDPQWGGPKQVALPVLVDWTQRPEAGIRHYSGTATYANEFAVADPAARLFLDLGEVRELAEVRVNGRSLGILWCPPFRIELTPALKAGRNRLEIDVVNFWPNRIIGDAALPAAQRLTRTNVRKLTAKTPLMPSGLLGPVRLMVPADPR